MKGCRWPCESQRASQATWRLRAHREWQCQPEKPAISQRLFMASQVWREAGGSITSVVGGKNPESLGPWKGSELPRLYSQDLFSSVITRFIQPLETQMQIPVLHGRLSRKAIGVPLGHCTPYSPSILQGPNSGSSCGFWCQTAGLCFTQR